jgi:hypothetical protein
VIIESGEAVEDPDHISEWLFSLPKLSADIIIDMVSKLNDIGINKNVTMQCTSCNNTWEDKIDLDPTSFFGKR